MATSTRLAGAAYTAPDNAGISAIGAKTVNLPSDPADNSEILAAITALNDFDPATEEVNVGSVKGVAVASVDDFGNIPPVHEVF